MQNYQKLKMFEIIQWGRFFGRLIGSILKTGLALMKNIHKRFVKRVLIALRLIAAA